MKRKMETMQRSNRIGANTFPVHRLYTEKRRDLNVAVRLAMSGGVDNSATVTFYDGTRVLGSRVQTVGAMMIGLKKIFLKGWKSIREVELELGPLNVLIGANGSGKSNFLSFFRLLNAMGSFQLEEYIARAGSANSLLHYGAKQTRFIEAELQFGTPSIEPYKFRLAHAANDALVFVDEKWSSRKGNYQFSGGKEMMIYETDDPDRLLFGFLSSCKVYHFNDTSAEASMRQSNYVEENRSLLGDARNLAAVLNRFRRTEGLRPVYDRIVATIRQINPQFGDFILEPRALNAVQIILNWREKGRDYMFGPHQLSDGTLRVMALATLLLQPENELPGILLIDEPELGLHPYAIGVLAALLRKVSHHSQVIVSTQSAELLNYFESEEVIVVDRKKEESEFRRLNATELEAWLEDYSLSELWEKNVLGGGPH
jgi:predicted ATPase